MIQCPRCGAGLPDNKNFCPNCGRSLHDAIRTAPVAPEQAPQAGAQQPFSAEQPPADAPSAAPGYAPPPPPPPQPPVYAAPQAPDAPVSIGTWIGVLVVLAIPVANLVCAIVWACCARRRSLKNFARAVILCWLIVLILAVLTGIVLGLAGVSLDIFPY